LAYPKGGKGFGAGGRGTDVTAVARETAVAEVAGRAVSSSLVDALSSSSLELTLPELLVASMLLSLPLTLPLSLLLFSLSA
jgi:hypothetical protein